MTLEETEEERFRRFEEYMKWRREHDDGEKEKPQRSTLEEVGNVGWQLTKLVFLAPILFVLLLILFSAVQVLLGL